MGNTQPQTKTSITPTSAPRSPWATKAQPLSHAAYRHAPAHPTRRAPPYARGPNVQHSAAAEGRRLQCIVRPSPPSLKLLIARAGREPLGGPPALKAAGPTRAYHKHASPVEPLATLGTSRQVGHATTTCSPQRWTYPATEHVVPETSLHAAKHTISIYHIFAATDQLTIRRSRCPRRGPS
jgi:hypothetical protein